MLSKMTFDDFAANKARIIADIESGADFDHARLNWTGLTRYMYDACIFEILSRLNNLHYPTSRSVRSMSDAKLLRVMGAEDVFDLNKSAGRFSHADVKRVLRSTDYHFSQAGFEDSDDQILKTVDEKMLVQINAAAHFISKVFVPCNTFYRFGSSYALKHAVEHFVRIASTFNPVPDTFYIANVSFILAALLCGIEIQRCEDTPNAELKMKPRSRQFFRLATGGL